MVDCLKASKNLIVGTLQMKCFSTNYRDEPTHAINISMTSIILAFTRFNEFLYCYICYKIYWYMYYYSILSPSRLLCYSISLQNTKETDGLHMPQLCVLRLKQQFVNAHSLRWLPKRFNILKSTVVNVLDNLIKLKDWKMVG